MGNVEGGEDGGSEEDDVVGDDDGDVGSIVGYCDEDANNDGAGEIVEFISSSIFIR